MTIKETILPLVDAYAEAKVAASISVSMFGKYSEQSIHRVNFHGKEKAALVAALDAADAEVKRLTALQYRQAPCHKFCEANAFTIEIRGLKAENEKLREALNAVYLECDWYGDNGRDAMDKAGKLLRGEA